MIYVKNDIIMLVEIEKNVFVRDEIPPDGFPLRKEKTGTCGHYSLKAVIEAKTKKPKGMREYSGGLRSYFTYFMTPRTIESVLNKHGVDCKILRVFFLRKKQKIALIKEKLLDGPLIIFIANGLTKDKRFSLKKALTHRHYITIRGYDDNEEKFFVYDSSCKRPEDGLYIGNIRIPYDIVIKERNLGIYKIFSNRGIAIKY